MEVEGMSEAQIELEKAKIQAKLRSSKKSGSGTRSFDITKQVQLVPRFTEDSIDEYFAHFERTAVNIKWPKRCWTMLLQTVLSGKAQKTYTALSTDDYSNYYAVKSTILKSYELVP